MAACVGAPVYMFVQHFAQQWNPYYWMFLIGGLLIVIVRFSRGGLLGLFDDLGRPRSRRGRRMSMPALEATGCRSPSARSR